METLLESSAIIGPTTTPLSWPHGLITSCRTVLLIDVWLARFARSFAGPASLHLNTGEHVFMLILLLFLAAEAVYSWLHIHRNSQFWTKMLLFYPIHAVVLFANGLCLINLLNDFSMLAHFIYMGWPIFWASIEMVCSLLVPALCGLHLCFGHTFELAMIEFHLLIAKTTEFVSSRRATGTDPRNGYENIE